MLNNFRINKISFINPQKKHLKIILTWFNKPHVKEFFDDPNTGKTIPDLKNYLLGKNHFITHWIALYEDSPFAYLLTTEITKSQNDIYGKWREKWYDFYLRFTYW